MAPSKSKRLIGRKVTAVACFDSFGKLAMTILAACRREGAETTLLLLELNNRALSRRQRLEIRRIDPKTRIEKHNWNDLRQLCGAMPGKVDAHEPAPSASGPPTQKVMNSFTVWYSTWLSFISMSLR